VINLIKTNKNGIPDLLCLKDGEKPIFIECKEKNDTVKPLQIYRINELNALGFNAFVDKVGKQPQKHFDINQKTIFDDGA